MAEQGVVTIYNSKGTISGPKTTPFASQVGMDPSLSGGAIFEVTNLKEAKIAEAGGARAVIVTELAPGGISRLLDPAVIREIKLNLEIPVIGRVRVGHFVEAQILEIVGVDCIDENELSVADEDNFINKHNFRTPFICGCRNLGEALRRVREGAKLVRIQGSLDGSGNVAETVGNVRKVVGELRKLMSMDADEVFAFSSKIGAAYDTLVHTKEIARLPVKHIAAGGIVTPADAAMMMQLGCDAVLVDNNIFRCPDPLKRVRAIVDAVEHYNDALSLAGDCSEWHRGMEDLRITEEIV